MSIFQGATNVAILGGTQVAVAAGSIVNMDNSGSLLRVSSALRDLSAAVAHTALHDSAARFDAPRCHRNTRASYLDKLELWMLGMGMDYDGKRFIWLHGGTGAGKSAIMQSIVERCVRHGVILGSFFFSRADASRNYAEVLIPTLAYQLARSFPATMAVLEPLIHRDPLIFKASLHTQAYELLVRPIQYLFETGIMDNTSLLRRVFIIDGLDECSDPQKQALIIRIIASVLHYYHIPICFLVASRPEIAISSAFAKEKQLHEVFSTITLDNDDEAESDIRQFIHDSFLDILDSHPLKTHIKLPWPSPYTIDTLVRKSSGHFIYAATVMRFISSSDEHPGRALKVVEGVEPSRTGSPFTELDALYVHILTSAKYSKHVLKILGHLFLLPLSTTVKAICYIHDISPQDISLYLSDVQSLVSLAPNLFAEPAVTPKHASLSDFFWDKNRSRMLYVSEEEYRARFLARLFQLLDDGPRTASFCFRHDDGLHFLPNGDAYSRHNDALGLIISLFDGLIHSEDTQLLQTMVSRHAPHDIWNFCVESFADDTISSTKVREFLAQAIGNYMRAIRDAVALRSDALYFDQFKMYFELLLDDLNDFVHLKPQYRIIPALLFFGTPSGIPVAHDLLYWWGRQFHIDASYRYYFWYALAKRGTFKIDPRAFRAIQCSPQSQISWSSDLAVAMELVLHRLVNLPWAGPFETLRTSPHRRWLQKHKPLKRVSLGSPRLSSASVLSINTHDEQGKHVPWNSESKSKTRLLLSCWRNFQLGNRKHRIYTWRMKCAVLLKTIIYYMHKSDCTEEVARLARRSLPLAAQWFPRLMKRARYQMDTCVRHWEESKHSDRLLKKAKLLPIINAN